MMVMAHILGLPVEELLASSAGAMTVATIALKQLYDHRATRRSRDQLKTNRVRKNLRS